MIKKRVAVTGLGLVTPCGIGWAPYWEAVRTGTSSLRELNGFPVNGLPVPLAGQISGFDPVPFVKTKKSLKLMSREIQLAVAASHLALQDAGISLERENADDFGVSLGTGIINNDLDEMGIGIRNGIDSQGCFQITKFGQEGIRSLFPLWLLKYLPNMPACHISVAHGLKGPSNTLTTSSAAGAHAIGEAFRVIERGDAVCMLAGGTDSKVNAMGFSRFQLLGLLSRDHGQRRRGYCPFDVRHDGIMVGEGAGLLVLEELDHALRRRARIYGEICGYGSASECHPYAQAMEGFGGKRLAMSRALGDAGMDANALDFILADGSGVAAEDVVEARAIQSLFGDHLNRLRVTGVKPITGHLVYGSAGVEVAAGVLALRENVIPPLINLEEPASGCSLPFVTKQAWDCKARAFLFNSFGFGGQNASLVFKKLETY